MKKTEKINSYPTSAVIAVTYKCNSKCIMCNIWKEPSKEELTAEDYLKLPKTLKDINITGGEPFLRKDIVDVVGNITGLNPQTRLVFSSNGFLTDQIVDLMQQIIKINSKACISISLDGIDEMHNKIRGIGNAYDKVLKTISSLKKANINDIRVGYTGSHENIKHLSKVYDLSQKLGIEFTLSVVHNSDNYFNIDTNLAPEPQIFTDELTPVINNELSFINPRRLLRTYYANGLIEFVKTGKRPLPCSALENFFMLDPLGDIYPCSILDTKLGNIKENSFNKIWQSKKTDKMRSYCSTCDKCWMVCTVKNSIMKEPFKVGGKVLMAKLRGAY